MLCVKRNYIMIVEKTPAAFDIIPSVSSSMILTGLSQDDKRALSLTCKEKS